MGRNTELSTKSSAAITPQTNESIANFRPKAASVRSQWDLVKQVTAEPSIVEGAEWDTLMTALQSQGGLAALELPERGIVAMSLNTQKALASEMLEGGYSALNDYRKAALASMKAFRLRSDKPGRGTLDWYKNELADKNDKLDKVVNEVAQMGQKLDEVLALAYQMAVAAGKEAEFIKRRGELVRKFPS